MELARRSTQMVKRISDSGAVEHPVPPRAASTAPGKPAHREHRRHSRRARHTRTLQLISLLMGLALVAVFIGWIKTWVDLNAMEQAHFDTSFQLRQTTQELEQLRNRSADLEQELRALVQQRLPHLRQLVFDTTLPIDEGYIRNITFRRTGVGSQTRYEYSLLLENPSRDTLTPHLRIVLFDETGIQTASAEVTRKAATTNADLEFLEPREVRAYSAIIPSERKQKPRYFQIFVE
jgi:cell division protein FtsB